MASQEGKMHSIASPHASSVVDITQSETSAKDAVGPRALPYGCVLIGRERSKAG